MILYSNQEFVQSFGVQILDLFDRPASSKMLLCRLDCRYENGATAGAGMVEVGIIPWLPPPPSANGNGSIELC